MPLNLRVGLRLLPGSILARRLETALASFEQAVAEGGQPSRLDLAHPLHMRRGFIRHPAYYRVKASISGLFQVLDAGALLPLVPVLWLLASKEDRAREAARYRAYLLKCEVEDLLDEIERRVQKRKQAT